VFYDKFVKICNDHGVSPSKAATEAGLSKSTVTKWKTTPDAQPTGNAIKKLAAYFAIPISELLGEEQKQKNPPGELVPTEREAKILEALRSKTPAEQKALLTLLGISED
jgi:transcriptional regulator with XRE-family HTH domain